MNNFIDFKEEFLDDRIDKIIAKNKEKNSIIYEKKNKDGETFVLKKIQKADPR